MKELAHAATEAADDPAVKVETQASVHDYCKLLCSGFGQTKIIEDSIGTLRDREQRDTTSRVLECLRQLAVMVDSGGLDQHRRHGG